MPVAKLKYIKRCAEFCSKDEMGDVPPNTRGIYALLHYESRHDRYDVVYIGMSGTKGIRDRLKRHERSKRKGAEWTHFSVFEVHDNIFENEIRELEGLFRHIYGKDTTANRLNRQRRFKKLDAVRDNLSEWKNKGER